jgi:hypothetical protein
MNFDKIVIDILEGYGAYSYRPTGTGHRTPEQQQKYDQKHGGKDHDQDVQNYGGNDDTKLYWEITRPDGTKYHMTKEPKFKNKNVRGPFRGRPPKQ